MRTISNALVCVAVLTATLISRSADAAIKSYGVNEFGQVVNSTSNRFYEADDDLETYWALNSDTNTVRLVNQGNEVQLQTNQFTVADITDVTWSIGSVSYFTVETTAPVPEPSSIISLAGLLISFGLFGWWKKRMRGAT